MMNIIKNIIFNLCILVSFQSISHAMEVTKIDKDLQAYILSHLASFDSYSYSAYNKKLKAPEPKKSKKAQKIEAEEQLITISNNNQPIVAIKKSNNLSEAEFAAVGLLGTFVYYKKLNTELVNIVETTFKDSGFEKEDLNKIKIFLERGAGNKKSHKVKKFLDSTEIRRLIRI